MFCFKWWHTTQNWVIFNKNKKSSIYTNINFGYTYMAYYIYYTSLYKETITKYPRSEKDKYFEL